MSKMQAPKSIREARFNKQTVKIDPDTIKINSFKYLTEVMKEVVNSEKHILDRNVLVLNTKKEANKLQITKAIEGISEGVKVVKVTSSNRKPYKTGFRGNIGKSKEYKQFCIRCDKPFDLSLIFGGEA